MFAVRQCACSVLCQSQKMKHKQKTKNLARTTCQADLTHEKPPKIKTARISSVKQRLSPPSPSIFNAASTKNPLSIYFL